MDRIDLLLLETTLALSERIAPFTFGTAVLPDTLLDLYPYEVIRNCFIECIWCELIETDDSGFLPARFPVIKGLTRDGYRFLYEFLYESDAFEALASKYDPFGTSTINYYHSWVSCDTPLSEAAQIEIANLIVNTNWNETIYIGKAKRKGTPLEDYSLAEIIFNFELMVKNNFIAGAELYLGQEPNIGKCKLSIRGTRWLNEVKERTC